MSDFLSAVELLEFLQVRYKTSRGLTAVSHLSSAPHMQGLRSRCEFSRDGRQRLLGAWVFLLKPPSSSWGKATSPASSLQLLSPDLGTSRAVLLWPSLVELGRWQTLGRRGKVGFHSYTLIFNFFF